MGLVNCSHCEKSFYKDNRHINENLKLGHNFYCSLLCQSQAKNKQTLFYCDNSDCKKPFLRAPGQVSPKNYCSHHCSAIVGNQDRMRIVDDFSKRPKRPYYKHLRKIRQIKKYCKNCKYRISRNRNFCSMNCFGEYFTKNDQQTINDIKKFVSKNGRIPLKREMGGCYKRARKFFGSWNKAIEAAGFKPNHVLFASRQVAKDGHACDSIAEMLIDNFLSERSIKHQRSVLYPKGTYTADFKIGDKWVEYFGLAGEHKRYDQLRRIKLKLVRKYKLDLVAIYPKDLYPISKLEKIIKDL